MDGHARRYSTAVDSDLDIDGGEPVEDAPDLGEAIGIMVTETGGALAGVGLTHAQFVLLLAVSEFEPVPTATLGRIMAVGERRRAAELAPLLSKGAVAFLEGSDETTERTVVTTAHGRTLLQRAIPLWEAAQGRIQARLGAGEAVEGESGKGSVKKPLAVG